MKPTLIVLAAGMGSRYGGLKQIDPVGPSDEVILDYSVYDAIHAGFGKIVFVIRKDIEDEFKTQVGSKYENRMPVEYVFQQLEDLPDGCELPENRTKPWGTLHAMLAARDVVNEPFGVINADDFYGPGSFEILAGALRTRAEKTHDYVLVAYPLKNTVSEHGSVSRGVCDVNEGVLAGVEECHGIHPVEGGIRITHGNGEEELVDGTQLVSMNTWGFTPEFFDLSKKGFKVFLSGLTDPLTSEYYIPSIVQEIVDEGVGKVDVLESHDSWLGVTYPEDKAAVMSGLRKLVDAGVYPSPLWG